MTPPPLSRYRAVEQNLSALVAAARALLSSTAAGPADERVAAWPDERTVRYYQSMGLVDRPLRHEGREAVYGYRHLLQAVAVKLLQGQGFSLAQAQRALAGQSTDALERAVAESLGSAPPEAPASLPNPLPKPSGPDSRRTLHTCEVAPGVLVTVDPRVVADPEALITRILTALTPNGGTP